MLKENVMERSIVKQTRDNNIQMQKGLTPNTSYDIFKLGDNISQYEKWIHHRSHYNDPDIYDDYEIKIHGYNIELWCNNGQIVDICCRESCIYNGIELINMKFEDFLNIIKEEPLNHDICYIPFRDNWGQNQHVYVFEKFGLQVWVWRGKIRTIVIYDTYADE